MIKECSAKDLKSKIDSKEKFQFIDCREQAEWNDAHIDGATLLPLSLLELNHSKVLTDKNAEIIIQCRSGARSMNACMYLMSKGYTNLTNLQGGIMGWMQAGYPVITE